MSYKVIKITAEDENGIHYEELGSVSLHFGYTYGSPSEDEIHNELSKEVYKFLLKNKSDTDLDNIAVVDEGWSSIRKIVWRGGDKKAVWAAYKVAEIKEDESSWRSFSTPGKDSKELENRIHYPINFNPYSFDPSEAIFSWYPLHSFFNLEDALANVNAHENEWHKHWIWHSEFEGKLEVLHVDYWEGEVKENFTERDLWPIVLKDREDEEKAFKEKEEEKKRLAEEAKRRREREEAERRAKYQAENPWYYLEDELKSLEEEASELSDRIRNRWDNSTVHKVYNSYWDTEFEEGEPRDLLGEDQANRIQNRLYAIGDRERELREAISTMRESKRAADEKKKQEEYYSKVDNLNNLLSDPIIAKRIVEIKRGA